MWRFAGEGVTVAADGRLSFDTKLASLRVSLLLYELFFMTFAVMTMSWQPLGHLIIVIVFSAAMLAYMISLLYHPWTGTKWPMASVLVVGIFALILMNVAQFGPKFDLLPYCADAIYDRSGANGLSCLAQFPWHHSPTFNNLFWFAEALALSSIALMAPVQFFSHRDVIRDIFHDILRVPVVVKAPLL